MRNELKKIDGKVIVKNDFKPTINDAMPFPLKIGKGFSEMAFFKNSIKFGAGNIRFAHSDNEQILRMDLNILPERLIKLIQSI